MRLTRLLLFDYTGLSFVAEHDTVVLGDSLYMWGGDELELPAVHDSVEKRTITSRLKVLHLPSGQWSIKTTSGNPPLGVRGYSCSTVGEKIYYFGGNCGHDDCCHNSLNELDTVTLTWKQLQPTDDNIAVMKRARSGMKTVEDDGTYLSIIGGEARSPPTVQLEQAQYTWSSNGHVVYTNECNMYNISTGKYMSNSYHGSE